MRRLLFSLIPLALLGVGLELGLRAAGYQGEPDRVVSWCREHAIPEPPFFPAFGISGPDAEQELVYRAPRIEGQPRPWAPQKAPGTRRVFAFGGSAVHGYGFTRVGAWPDRVEALLADHLDGPIEVVNAGVIAWSSQQVLMLVTEVLADHEPDALVIYSGNNELLEWFDARRYLPEPELRRWVRALTWGRRLRTLRSYRLGVGLLSGVDAGHWGQTNFTDDEALPWPERARMSDADRAFAEASYRYNIGRVLELADAAGVPVILSTVAANYDDAPGEFDFGQTEPSASREHLQAAEARLSEGDLEGAEALAARALDAWPEAIVHHRWAQILRRYDQPEAARRHYRRAMVLDENPHRAPPYINDAIRDLADGAAGFVDGEALIAELVEDGIPDWTVIYDHCHPTPDGHAVLARAFARELAAVWGQAIPDPLPEHPAAGPDHVDAWLGEGVDPVTGTYVRDPGTERKGWWRAAAAAAEGSQDPARWNDLGVVAWHTFHADCERDRAPCLQVAADAFQRAAALDPAFCPAQANLGRLLFALNDERAGAHLQAAIACDPADARSAWYLSRLEK